MAGKWMSPKPLANRSSKLSFEFEPSSLDFGEVWESEQFEWPLTFKNEPSRPIVMEQLRGDCSCATVGSLPLAVAPHSHETIRLTIDLFKFRPSGREEVTPYRLELNGEVLEGSLRRPISAVLSGRVKRAVHMEQSTLDFGSQSVRTANIEKTLSLTTSQEVHALEFDKSPLWAFEATREKSDVIKAGHRWVVAARFHPKPFPMKIDGSLSIHPTDANGKRLTTIRMDLRGELVQDVVARPSTIHILLGRATKSEETISLLSLTGSPFTVEGIAAGEGIAVQKVESASVGDAEYRVKLTKTRAEIVNGRIVFKIRENPDSLEYALEVPVAVH
ncbi:MAG: hypothetical protein U0791_12010 [Gemmataceae bacterium]